MENKENAPRSVRPSWIAVNIEGRQRFASGPRSRSGSMTTQFSVRDKGISVKSIRIECLVVDETHVLTVFDEHGQAIYNHVTELD